MTEKKDTLQKLKDFLEHDQNVVFAVIFGSAATGRQNKKSDIDIGIYFHKPPQGFKLLDYISRLSDLAGREIDISVLNTASAFLRHQVMKNRVILIIKDRELYRKFRERTISDYDEFKYMSGITAHD